jgi:hypothetical protein
MGQFMNPVGVVPSMNSRWVWGHSLKDLLGTGVTVELTESAQNTDAPARHVVAVLAHSVQRSLEVLHLAPIANISDRIIPKTAEKSSGVLLEQSLPKVVHYLLPCTFAVCCLLRYNAKVAPGYVARCLLCPERLIWLVVSRRSAQGLLGARASRTVDWRT